MAKTTAPPESLLIDSETLAAQEESYWRSLSYFAIYRIILATGFALAAMIFGSEFGLGEMNIDAFKIVSGFYVLAALIILVAIGSTRRHFDLQLTLQVLLDVFFITLMMYYSGGQKSNVGALLFIVLAGAGLVGQGRLLLLHASIASLAVLIEQSYRFLNIHEDGAGFVRVGLICIGYFGTAMIARLLATAVVASENLARRRGQDLLNQQRISQRIIRDMEDGVLVINAHQALVEQINPQALRLLNSNILVGKPIDTFSPALADILDRWQQTPHTGADTLLTMPGGRGLRVRILPPEGTGNSILIYLEDISRKQEQLQQIKLAALGRLTANMAHEIRNPLAAISQAAELLPGEPTDEVRARLVRIIGNNVQRLNRLVNDILDLGRRDQAVPELLDVAGQFREYLDELALQVDNARARVIFSCPEGLMLRFDRIHFHRILANLVTNSLRYASQSPGSVCLLAKPTAHGEVAITVRDDGPGVAHTLRGQIFEPFFTTDAAGTGLGLYISRSLCEANHASLELLDHTSGAHFRILCQGA